MGETFATGYIFPNEDKFVWRDELNLLKICEICQNFSCKCCSN